MPYSKIQPGIHFVLRNSLCFLGCFLVSAQHVKSAGILHKGLSGHKSFAMNSFLFLLKINVLHIKLSHRLDKHWFQY